MVFLRHFKLVFSFLSNLHDLRVNGLITMFLGKLQYEMRLTYNYKALRRKESSGPSLKGEKLATSSINI